MGGYPLKIWSEVRFPVIQYFTIVASFLVAIFISDFFITISANRIKSFTISTHFRSNDVIGSVLDVTWNSNWATWISLYSFPSRLLENPVTLHVKSFMKSRNWMDLNWRISNFKRYMNRNLRRCSRCSSRKRWGYSNVCQAGNILASGYTLLVFLIKPVNSNYL